VLGEIQSPVGFEEVRNKLIIDLFYTTGIRRTELIHLKISDIDASKFSIKVLGKGIKKESFQFSYY
jgi:integrase/recombinase XerC